MLAGLDGGVGATVTLLSRTAQDYYMQLGHINDDGRGFYMTAGSLREEGHDTGENEAMAIPDNGWLGTVAYQWRLHPGERRLAAIHLFATGIYGHRVPASCIPIGPGCSPTLHPRTIILGAILQNLGLSRRPR